MLGLRKRLGFARSGRLGALVARGDTIGSTSNTPIVVFVVVRLCAVKKAMSRYCLPGLDISHTPTLGHQTSKQLICPKDADCLHVPKPDPCKPTGPVRALACVPGYVRVYGKK